MRTFEQIRKQAQKGDLHRIAEAIGCSYELVKKVVYEKAKDHKNIQAAFDKYLNQRDALKREFGENH